MISSNTNKKRLPTHVTIRKEDSGLPEDSVIMLEQIRTIDKRRLSERMGAIGEKELLLIDEAVKCSLAIT